jgi:hypothetical protein
MFLTLDKWNNYKDAYFLVPTDHSQPNSLADIGAMVS